MRLGHVRERGLVKLAKQVFIGIGKLNKLELFDHFILGNQHRMKFGSGVHNSSRPFDPVHSDLWGLARVETHGGGFYFIYIIDDLSIRVWFYILKSKNDTFEKVNEWYSLIANQVETKLNVLRTNNGLEFISEGLMIF